MKLSFVLNGEKTVCEIAPDMTLLNTLRMLGMHSVRSGCDTTNCGICTVWVEGKPVLSCSYPAARCEGLRVTTIEGVKTECEDIFAALAQEGADQCGFCSPGLIMTILAMLRELPDPTDEEIRAYLSGNLCRCTGYVSQLRAIRRIYEGRKSAK